MKGKKLNFIYWTFDLKVLFSASYFETFSTDQHLNFNDKFRQVSQASMDIAMQFSDFLSVNSEALHYSHSN